VANDLAAGQQRRQLWWQLLIGKENSHEQGDLRHQHVAGRFITASGQTAEEPLGLDGERLHTWAFEDNPVNREYLERAVSRNGAIITGRANYDQAVPFWGADGPTGPARVPVFVVTHSEPTTSPEGGVYAIHLRYARPR
jgi:hypothetical protein